MWYPNKVLMFLGFLSFQKLMRGSALPPGPLHHSRKAKQFSQLFPIEQLVLFLLPLISGVNKYSRMLVKIKITFIFLLPLHPLTIIRKASHL